MLEDGTIFAGRAVGASGVSSGEACFTTAMAGYEEAVTDPSYAAQVLTFSYPLIGNYGVDESPHGVGSGLDGGRRHAGACRPAFAALARRQGRRRARGGRHARARPARPLGGRDALRARRSAARRAARARARRASHRLRAGGSPSPSTAHPPLGLLAGTREPYTVGAGPRVAVVDFGCKRSIVRRLAERGLEVAVCPPTWDADAVLALVAAGGRWSETGPAIPAQLADAIETVRELLGRVPLFGVCLGHQLLGLALGMRTFKLPFGHRGANHPVRVRVHASGCS